MSQFLRLSRAVVAGVLALAMAQAAVAQAPSPAPATGGQAAAAPAPPTPADLIQRMDALRSRLDEVDTLLGSPLPAVTSVRATLPGLDQQLSSGLRATEPAQLSRASELDLRVELQNLQRLSREAATLRDALQPAVAAVEPRRAALKDDLDFIAAAKAAGLDAELPAVLREQLPGLERRAANLRAALLDRLNQPVALLVRINRMADQLDVRTQSIKQTISRRERNLLSLSAPPLWQVMGSDPRSALGDILGRDLGVMLQNGRDFVQVNSRALWLFVLLYAGLVALALRLRRYVPEGTGQPDQPTDLVLTRPVLVTTLIWAILGPELVLPELPPGMGLLRGGVALVALGLVVPAYAAPGAVLPVRALLLVTLLAIAERLLLGDALYGRSLAILLAIVAIVIFRRLPVRQDGTSLHRLADLLRRFSPPLLAGGILAEVLGAEALGGELVTGVLFLAALLTAFMVADVLLADLLRLLVAGPLSDWSRAVARHPELVRRRVGLVLRATLLLTFVAVVPRVVSMVQPLWEAVADFFGRPIGIGAISLAPADLLRFAVGVVLAVALSRGVRFLLDGDVLPRLAMSRGTRSTVSRLTYYVILIAGVGFAFAAAGLQFSQLALLVGALGVGIGLGLQNVVSNFVSGLIIAFEQPFREGDVIEVASVSGTVEEIGLRASRLRSADGAEMIVPNAALLSGELTNWTLSDRSRRIEIAVGVAYGSDPRQVQAVLLRAVAGLPGLAPQPEANVVFRGLGASSLDFGVLLWTNDVSERLSVEGEARMRVLEALDAAGIEIPFPQLDVHLRPAPPASPPAPPVAG